MTHEIERMAREAGGSIVREADARAWAGLMAFDGAELARFAALVAADTRERCAKVCEDSAASGGLRTSIARCIALAAAIRAGG